MAGWSLRARLRAWLTGWVLCGGGAVAASEAPPVPVEAFFSHPEIRSVSLSPGGEYLALLMGGSTRRAALWVVPLADLSRTRLVGGFADFDIDYYRWVDNERLIYGVYDSKRGGADQYRTGLTLARADGRQIRRFADKALLSIPDDGSGDIIVGEARFSGTGDLQSIKPWRYNLDTGNLRWAVADEPGPTLQWWFDRKGEARLALTSQAKGQRTWHLREPGKPGWVVIQSGSPLEFTWEPADIDRAGQLYVSENSPEGFRQLKRWDAEARRPAKEPLVGTPGFDLDGEVLSDDVTGALLGVRVETDVASTQWFDAGMRALQAEVDRKFPQRVNVLSCRRCTAPDRVVLVRSFSPREPAHWHVVQGTTELRWLEIGRARKAIDPARMADVEFHRIKARDGRDLPVWLTVPSSPPRGTPLPAVVLVHGGPWVRGGHWAFDELDQFLASRGYLVIKPEFRGSTGYGDAHFRAGIRQWGRAMQDDVADALQWAVQQRRADPQRTCIAGGSYGGYSALMGLIRHPEQYRCGIAWVAVTDPRLLFEPLWRSTTSDDARRYGMPQLIGDPSADADYLREVSPVAQASKLKAPLLLAFGEYDGRVPIDHAKALRKALRDAGQEPEYVIVPDEGHVWLKAASWIDFARRIERFLARHTAPRSGP